MLEHYFCLVEFKPVFEFICLNSFENFAKHFPLLTQAFLAFSPANSSQPSSVPPRPGNAAS
jgi:hypothetical protein